MYWIHSILSPISHGLAIKVMLRTLDLRGNNIRHLEQQRWPRCGATRLWRMTWRSRRKFGSWNVGTWNPQVRSSWRFIAEKINCKWGMFNCPVWLLEGNWVYHEGIYNQYSIVVGGTIDQLVAGCSWGGLPTTNHVWGWNQQPMRIINQWKFCQQEDVLLRRWLVFQIQGFLPSTRSSNRWAHLAGAQVVQVQEKIS